MISSLLFTLLLLPMMVFSLGPKVTIRSVLSLRSVLNTGVITCANCPVVSLNTTDAAVNVFSLTAGTDANTFAIQDATGKYYVGPGQNDQFIVEWSSKPSYWLFTNINSAVYTISDVATTSPNAKCWITSSDTPSQFGQVNYDICPGTIPSAWAVTDAN